MSKTPVQKCIEWNEVRYAQVFNGELAINLLKEEINETLSADDPIAVLDGIGDVFFVCIGILWKLGFSSETIHNIMAYEYTFGNEFILSEHNFTNIEVDHFLTNYSYGVIVHIEEDALATREQVQFLMIVFTALFSMLVLLRERGLIGEVYNILDAICDSNNTKSLPENKVDPSVKANVDKGPAFIPPTMALKRILSKYTN